MSTSTDYQDTTSTGVDARPVLLGPPSAESDGRPAALLANSPTGGRRSEGELMSSLRRKSSAGKNEPPSKIRLLNALLARCPDIRDEMQAVISQNDPLNYNQCNSEMDQMLASAPDVDANDRNFIHDLIGIELVIADTIMELQARGFEHDDIIASMKTTGCYDVEPNMDYLMSEWMQSAEEDCQQQEEEVAEEEVAGVEQEQLLAHMMEEARKEKEEKLRQSMQEFASKMAEKREEAARRAQTLKKRSKARLFYNLTLKADLDQAILTDEFLEGLAEPVPPQCALKPVATMTGHALPAAPPKSAGIPEMVYQDMDRKASMWCETIPDNLILWGFPKEEIAQWDRSTGISLLNMGYTPQEISTSLKRTRQACLDANITYLQGAGAN
jgi:hypothetical protein